MLNRGRKLDIAKEAARVQQRLGLREIVLETGLLDVYDVIEKLQIPLMFKPMDGLLGAYLPTPSPGVLITTSRSPSIQRFTAAHELGHAMLGHKPSLDDESILRRLTNTHQQRGLRQEEEANFFATTFMLPIWLVNHHASLQGWKRKDLANPFNLYQLSLRVGLSYTATCVGLRQHNLLESRIAEELMKIAPRRLKQEGLGQIEPRNFHCDVWYLTASDNNSQLESFVQDYFVVEVLENSGAGYRWNITELERNGVEIVEDSRVSIDVEAVGSPVVRRIVLRWVIPQAHKVMLYHTRPWEGTTPAVETLRFTANVRGKVEEGLSEMTRRRLLGVA